MPAHESQVSCETRVRCAALAVSRVSRWILPLVLFTSAPFLKAQGSLRLDFEGQEPTWQQVGGDAQYSILAHQRVAGAAQSGQRCEFVRLSAGNGSYVYLRHEISAARVIEELRTSVWIKANRPGVQLLVRAVLPRTLDPATNQPATIYLRGASYTQVGSWQQLRIEGLPKQLQREEVWMRTRLGSAVDAREAYLDAVLLNIYGGPGATQVWIDDLEIAGIVGRPPQSADTVALTRWTSPTQKPAVAASQPALVEMNGSLLLVEGKPFFARAIEYQGEPLKYLRSLGFNTAKLARFPSPPLLAEAEEAGIWLICPSPPLPLPLSSANLPGWSRILCWDLGEQLSGEELAEIKVLAEELRSLDPRLLRPLTAEAETDLRAYSREIELLRASRAPLCTSLELADYNTWLRERPRLARPGTTLWTTVQTEVPQAVEQQLRLLPRPAPPQLASEHLRLVTYSALATGVRGLIFASRTRLDLEDAPSKHRALTLELLNLDLDLMEPFCAGGSFGGLVQGSVPEVRAAVLQAERARLLLPHWSGRYSQYAPAQAAANDLVFTVPGVPESCDAYEVTSGGLRSLKSSRKTGGMRVTIDEFGLTSAILLTYDPLALNNLTRKVQQSQRRAAELQRQLAAMRLADVQRIDRQLPPLPQTADAAEWIKTAQGHLQQADTHFNAGPHHYAAAFQQAARAMRPLRMVERAHWDQARAAIGSATAMPAAASYSTLPQFWNLLNTVRNSQVGLNVLPGGDCESLPRLMESGWRHFEHPQETVHSEVQLSSSEPHTGDASLQLRVWPADAQTAVGLLETPPVWITTAPAPVETGQFVRIRGWVDVPTPISGSVDGLLIFDSISGPALAERIGQTRGWQEFSLYRMAPQTGPITVTFALSGVGLARLDDITIEPVQIVSPQQARLP